ncbi:MAG: hypothetical protein R3B54_14355 [Bdellovibrionota bacterium]
MDSRGELSTLRDEKAQLTKNLQSKELELKRTIQAYQALLGKLDEGCLIFQKTEGTAAAFEDLRRLLGNGARQVADLDGAGNG